MRLEASADPRDVWVERDTLENAIIAAGKSPVPYSKLHEEMRAAPGVWYGVPNKRVQD
ncbi:DUF2316 family protein [Glutamicibacter sp. M10]|uniref:DUF2316 family protein n=1 Tax=Glutamicibacter sp. M10 TaxID=3023076 RepID=UPI001A90F1D6